MDVPVDAWFLLPALFFTLLAVVVAALVMRKNKCPTPSASTQSSRAASWTTREDPEPPRPLEALTPHTERGENTERAQELLPGDNTESKSPAHTAQNPEENSCLLSQTTVDNKSETVAGSDESANCPPVPRGDHEDKPLKYMPGMLRTSQLEKMMSKEELEEERRVQQDQLAAIFKLLKENQDTFGEVTEKDMEEQLKLYSI